MNLNLSNWFGQNYITYNAIEFGDPNAKYEVRWLTPERAGAVWDVLYGSLPPSQRPLTREEYIEGLSLQRMLTNQSSMSDFIGTDRDIKVTTNPAAVTGNAPDYLDDFILTRGGNDLILTYGGDDLIFSDNGNDVIQSGSGDDVVFAGNGADLVFGGDGNDQIFGDAALQKGRNGFDPKISTQDVLDGISFTNATSDAGQNGKIYVDYTEGNKSDVLQGGKGDDYIDGGKGNDNIFGNEDNDTLLGGEGSDIIFGGAGNDLIDAGPRGTGDDNLDRVIGGAGNDTFLLTGSKNGSNQSFVDQWASLGSVSTATDAISSALTEAAATLVSEALDNIGSKVLGTFAVGAFGPLGGAILDIGVGLLMDQLTGSSGSSADMIQVMDFNPAEDILAIPARLGVQLKYDAQEVTVNGKTTVMLQLTYQPDVTETNIQETDVFAQIYLDPAYLESIGKDASSTETAKAIFEDLIKSGVSINQGGLGNTIDPNAPAVEITGDYIQLIGATGPLIRDGSDDTDLAPLVGGRFADVITANLAFIDANDQLSVSRGEGGQLKSTTAEIHGLGGADIIYGTAANDRIYGGDGDDVIYSFGTDGKTEIIEGGNGNDKVITGMANMDLGERNYYTADGGAGRDTFDLGLNPRGVELKMSAVPGQNNANTTFMVTGKEKDATINNFELKNFEVFHGTRKADDFDFTQATEGVELHGENGHDKLLGGSGNDKLRGGNGNDKMQGGAGKDGLNGGNGNDTLSGGNDNDALFGAKGADRLIGGNGKDKLNGGSGNDALIGGRGHDQLNGGSGNDTLVGNRGKDKMTGGTGDDKLTGGLDADTFFFQKGSGNDTITDFDMTEDSIQIRVGLGLREEDISITRLDADRAQISYDNDSVLVMGTGAGDLGLSDLMLFDPIT